MKQELKSALLLLAMTLTLVSCLKPNVIVADENIQNHRLTDEAGNGPDLIKSISTTTTTRPSSAQDQYPTVQFQPSPVDDFANGHEVAVVSPSSLSSAVLQVQPISSQTEPKPIVTRSLGQSGEQPVERPSSKVFMSNLESPEAELFDTSAQTYYNNANSNGRTLVIPGIGWNIGSGNYYDDNLPCTRCNTILSSSFGNGYGSSSNGCCAHGFSTCCYIGVKPAPTPPPSYYPITSINPYSYSFGGHSQWKYPYNTILPISQSSIFGRGAGSGLGFGPGLGLDHTYNSGSSGYYREKPGSCYRPGTGYGGGYTGYAYDSNNAGYSFHRSDTDYSINARNTGPSKRDVYPTQQTFSVGSAGYGSPSYSSGSGYYGGSGGGYSGGGGHGGIIYPPTTYRPSYCRRDYDCPGNQKCCNGGCRTPAFTG